MWDRVMMGCIPFVSSVGFMSRVRNHPLCGHNGVHELVHPSVLGFLGVVPDEFVGYPRKKEGRSRITRGVVVDIERLTNNNIG